MIKKALKVFFIAIIAALYLTPFYILITYSLKAITDLSSKWIFPNYLYIDNYINVFKKGQLLVALKNNIIITLVSVVSIIFIGALASYPLARFKTKFNKLIYVIIIAFMIVPPLTILVPLYKFVVDIKGMNSYWTIILLHITFNCPMAVFLYTGFINSISSQLDEAAYIDGCNRFSIFFKIIFPLLKTVSLTVAILSGNAIWNDYQFSVFFLENRKMFTPTRALSQFVSMYNTELGIVAAGCIVTMLPIVIIYFFLQKYFVSGMVAGAIKG